MPLNRNGKVDRQQLLNTTAQDASRTGAIPAGVGPPTGSPSGQEMSSLILSLVSELLEVPEVKPEDNFLALGGNSLLGMRVISRVRSYLHIEIELSELLISESLDEFCQFVMQTGQPTGR
jgi:acyl carrier protein